VPLDVHGSHRSPLDPEERSRLRAALGTADMGEASFDPRPQRPVAPVEAPVSEAMSFQLVDLERKVDKLLDTAVTIDQLAAQVRALNEHVIELERTLIGLR